MSFQDAIADALWSHNTGGFDLGTRWALNDLRHATREAQDRNVRLEHSLTSWRTHAQTLESSNQRLNDALFRQTTWTPCAAPRSRSTSGAAGRRRCSSRR